MKIKKLTSMLVFVAILAVLLTSCQMEHEEVLDTLPNYFASFEYLDPNGFRDYTFYCKYYFKDISAATFEDNRFFNEVKKDDLAEILSFIDEYESTTKSFEEVSRIYDFDKSVLKTGDFFYIKTLEGEPAGERTYEKFDYYSVFYFDLENQILYYFHND